MKPLLPQLERYLKDALGDASPITPWKDQGRLAFFLRDRYRFFEGRILGEACVFMADAADAEASPATIRKHLDQVHATGMLVYVREGITAYHRKRLVEQKIPFVVPGNQMYLPMVGVDFREHFPRHRRAIARFRPSSQAVLIYALLQDAEDLGPTALAERLGYSPMAMSRSLDELEAAGITEPTARGRGSDRRLRFNASGREVWAKSERLLRTPVASMHDVFVEGDKRLPGLRAGVSGLAHHSMLAEPSSPTIAVSRTRWRSIEEAGSVRKAMADDPGAVSIEVWAYPPELFATEGRVDRLSLYLSLRDTQDERVQAALAQMMEEVPW